MFFSKISRRLNYYRSRLKIHWNLARLRNHRFHNPEQIHLTATGATDGGCAQLLRQISTIAFTRAFGFSYIHTPLSSVAHNLQNDPQWENKWESFLNLASFNRNKKLEPPIFKNVENLNGFTPDVIKREKSGDNLYYRVLDSYLYTNKNPESHSKILEDLRNSYENNGRSLDLVYDTSKYNIAIHVRRGDVSRKGTPNRFTSAEKLKKVTQQIKSTLSAVEYKISLFTINIDEDLQSLRDEKVQIIHKMDIFEVLDHLIHSDLLVTSKSSVGYLSAFLNKGIVVYEPFWHPPLPGWLNMDEPFEKELIRKLGHSSENR